MRNPNRSLGVYIHFPWCLAKCPYCDFLSVAIESDHGGALTSTEARTRLPHERYADAVLRELQARLKRLPSPPPPLRSVFFGGGTPSLWNPESVSRVLTRTFELFEQDSESSEVEVTIECNPTSFDEDVGRALMDAGVGRVSIGVQSLSDERLRYLGRLHDEAGGLRAVRDAVRSNVPRVSADLIYGIYGQDPAAAVQDVDTLVDTGITHLSAYTLTIEPGTRFGAMAAQGKLPLLEDALVAQSYTAVSDHLSARGFRHYEVSNFARPGQQSVHNLGYWLGRDYLGLGTGAVGTVTLAPGPGRPAARLRYKNLLSPERYMAHWLTSGDLGQVFDRPSCCETEVITPEIAHQEALLLGLRTEEGVDLDAVAELRGGDPWTRERMVTADRLVDAGMLIRRGSRLRIDRRHWLFADGIIRELL